VIESPTQDIPTQVALACPQCEQTMAHLVLSGHGPQPVVVDHCPGCRLVWFDALESVELSGAGWVRLLRELVRSAALEPDAARPLTLHCPVCHEPLKSVHNLTRYGRFPALECPQRHGHLHGHSGVLAERGLVRPLLPPERAALASERRVLHCFNCGARCDGQGDHCSYCASPLVVIDLPRLAYALLRRPGDDSPSPPPDGVPLAWTCHGCGGAVDPSREAACPRCGHAVVAPALLDIMPLLTSIETRLRQAEVATRPYRQRPPRARTWRDTGLGMLERFWRADTGDRRTDAQAAMLWVVALLIVWAVVIKR
jgi:hypothetical protein